MPIRSVQDSVHLARVAVQVLDPPLLLVLLTRRKSQHILSSNHILLQPPTSPLGICFLARQDLLPHFLSSCKSLLWFVFLDSGCLSLPPSVLLGIRETKVNRHIVTSPVSRFPAPARISPISSNPVAPASSPLLAACSLLNWLSPPTGPPPCSFLALVFCLTHTFFHINRESAAFSFI